MPQALWIKNIIGHTLMCHFVFEYKMLYSHCVWLLRYVCRNVNAFDLPRIGKLIMRPPRTGFFFFELVKNHLNFLKRNLFSYYEIKTHIIARTTVAYKVQLVNISVASRTNTLWTQKSTHGSQQDYNILN